MSLQAWVVAPWGQQCCSCCLHYLAVGWIRKEMLHWRWEERHAGRVSVYAELGRYGVRA